MRFKVTIPAHAGPPEMTTVDRLADNAIGLVHRPGEIVHGALAMGAVVTGRLRVNLLRADGEVDRIDEPEKSPHVQVRLLPPGTKVMLTVEKPK